MNPLNVYARAEIAENRVQELEAQCSAMREQITKLEAVAEAAKELIDWLRVDLAESTKAKKVREALAALEGGNMDTLRPEIIKFARLMEAKLKANDHKGGWKNCEVGWLLMRLGEEFDELVKALYYEEERLPSVIASEAADVANFAMMIADVCGGLVGD